MPDTHDAEVLHRSAALEVLFTRIATTRMQGVPILHPGLHVQAVGFEAEPDGRAMWGVLITPWFMNLMRVPLAADATIAGLRQTCTRAVGLERFDFIGGLEDGFGPYAACSLFSPMANFVDHAAALATAQAVLDELRRVPPPPDVVASRRALLFGRPEEATR